MRIPRIDFLIFGYRKIRVSEKDFKAALNEMLKAGISVKASNFAFYVSERDFLRIQKLFAGKISYSESMPLGLFGTLKRYKKRYGLILGVFVSLFLIFSSVGTVWDVRLEGSLSGRDEEILSELSSAGVYPGASLRKIDKAKIEAKILSESENVSWININQRGCVLYVKVIDKTDFEEEKEKTGFANVVAKRDCVIEEITVKTGIAMVKPGETVKKGEILISGVIPGELGGGFCYAEGKVIGRFKGAITVEIPECESEKYEKSREISKISIRFFNFSFKFLEKYRKSPEECDIIKEKPHYLTFFGKSVPISLQKEYRVIYGDSVVRYTQDEMARLAALRMRDAINSELSDKNLIKLKTFGEFKGALYVFTTEYVVSSDVGETRGFDFVER